MHDKGSVVAAAATRKYDVSILPAASALAKRLIDHGLSYIGLGVMDAGEPVQPFRVGNLDFYLKHGVGNWRNSAPEHLGARKYASARRPYWIDGSDMWIPAHFSRLIEREMAERGLGAAAVVPLVNGEWQVNLVLATDLEGEVLGGVLEDSTSAINLAIAEFARRLAEYGLAPESSIHLTAREVDVLTLTARGKTRDEAAVVMHISPLTVKDHLQRAGRKLKASNKTHAVARAMVMGLISV